MPKRSRRVIIYLVVMLLAMAGLLISPFRPAQAGSGDNYPSPTGTAFPDCTLDDWGYCKRYCTSWVAWALHDRNGFELPSGLGNASTWKDRAAVLGYTVNTTPAAGAVAWWSWNHVAWVKSVSADGQTVDLEEYNNPAGSGAYNARSANANNPHAYIHFKDLNGSGGGGTGSDGYFHGTPPDNAVIENYDGGLHKYVALGGSLIYIPETEYIWNYIHEMEVKIPSGQFHVTVRMHNNDIHAIEYGFGGNRSHVPADGSFFYERGSQQQYVMRFGYAFPVNGMGELEYLGGVNRAVMVPPGTAQRLSGTPVIPNDVLFRALGPTLYHEVNGTGFWVPNTPTADCIRVAKHAEFRPVPDSLLANQQAAGRLSMQPTNCTFPHGQVLYGQPSGRQAIVLYGKGFAIGSPQEAAAIGAVNLAQPVADQTIDMLLGLASQVPDGHVFRAGLETAAYQYASGTLRPIDAPLLRDCLLVGGNLGSAEEVVPQSFIAAFAVGASASCQLDNRQLLGPDGASVGYIKDGTRHWVPNPAVRDCLAARSGTGQPVQASSLLWNSYSQGSNAYCPYHLEPGLNFVQEQGSPIVWLVGPAAGGAGMKRHAGSLCVPDPYTTPIKVAHVFMVPAGETAGLAQGADWWPTGADCQALPG